MLVDDNDAFLSAMELLLPRLFDVEIVVSARSGQEALDSLARHDIDLALVDYKMPGLNGLTFASRARTDRHWTRILLVTFNPGSSLSELARDSGADGVINKAEIQADLEDYLPRWFGCGGRREAA
jgi:two-component system nitrate/nitrite response regulator NarL